MTDTRRPEVLFVCVHNAGRSQMAAALLAHHGGDRVVVRSAGTAPADTINPAVVEAMAEIGFDLRAAGAHPKRLDDAAVQASDVVITMGCGDNCPFYPGKRYLDWQLDDPAGQGLEAVRAIRDEIGRRVQALLAELTATAATAATAATTPIVSSTITGPAASGTTRPAGGAGSPAAPAPTTLSAPPETTAPPPNAPPPTSPPATAAPPTAAPPTTAPPTTAPPTTAPPTTAPPLPKLTSAFVASQQPIVCQVGQPTTVIVKWTSENTNNISVYFVNPGGQNTLLNYSTDQNGVLVVTIPCLAANEPLLVRPRYSNTKVGVIYGTDVTIVVVLSPY